MNGKKFVKQAQKIFSFLLDNGFSLMRAEPDKTGIRWEDVLEYRSDHLMFLVQRSSDSDGVWTIIGRPREHYPDGAIGLTELLQEIGIKPAKSDKKLDSIQQAQEAASLWQKYFLELLRGDIGLLKKIWDARENASKILLEYQRKIALKSEVIDGVEILELPNTAEALGEDYIARFPTHDFSKDKVWIVVDRQYRVCCQSYEAAVRSVDLHKGA